MMELNNKGDGFRVEWKTREAADMSPELAYMATILAARKEVGLTPRRNMCAWSCCPCLRRLLPVNARKTAA